MRILQMSGVSCRACARASVTLSKRILSCFIALGGKQDDDKSQSSATACNVHAVQKAAETAINPGTTGDGLVQGSDTGSARISCIHCSKTILRKGRTHDSGRTGRLCTGRDPYKRLELLRSRRGRPELGACRSSNLRSRRRRPQERSAHRQCN